MGRKVRNIRWSVPKKEEWYHSFFSIPPMEKVPQVLISEFPNHKAFFSRKFNWLDFIKEFKKKNINFEIISHLSKKNESALIALKDIDFFISDKSYWEYCFFIVPNSIIDSKTLSLPNRDFEYEITGSDLELLDCPLLYWYNDHSEIMITTKNKKVIDEHLTPLFKWILEKTEFNYLEIFTDEIILKIMNQEEGSFEISNRSFKQHDDGSVSFQLWNSCHNPPLCQMSTVVVRDNKVNYSDWETRNQGETPYNVENRKGQISCVIFIIILIIGLFYLIKFLIGIF